MKKPITRTLEQRLLDAQIERVRARQQSIKTRILQNAGKCPIAGAVARHMLMTYPETGVPTPLNAGGRLPFVY